MSATTVSALMQLTWATSDWCLWVLILLIQNLMRSSRIWDSVVCENGVTLTKSPPYSARPWRDFVSIFIFHLPVLFFGVQGCFSICSLVKIRLAKPGSKYRKCEPPGWTRRTCIAKCWSKTLWPLHSVAFQQSNLPADTVLLFSGFSLL